MLADYKAYPFSFIIGRLRKITILNEPTEILSRNLPIFAEMENQGPQYSYDINKANTSIKVYLTKRGKQMFKSIYLHRPKCSKIESEYYYFDCSFQQAFQYFNRFGQNAVIVEPNTLTNDLLKFYTSGKKAYINYINDGTLKDIE